MKFPGAAGAGTPDWLTIGRAAADAPRPGLLADGPPAHRSWRVVCLYMVGTLQILAYLLTVATADEYCRPLFRMDVVFDDYQGVVD